ncbi:calcium-binding protein [Pseudodesulfovibrio cashew]|uniref:Calcium-binding protein n=1 Tax=Pseudodesulfovibrio cashew TaxID=2678688 RepID=A0A6I6JCS1_9BACT|nr:calcium-binding protein [Pseudodesulfovibrio cashew]QGY39881.1 calcium-binding protein [Pseudodesulfovibrio cashew]
MKRTIFTTVLAALLLLAATAYAQQVPELRGTWKGETKIQTLDRVIESECAIVIDVQNGNTFTGYKLYFKKKVLTREKLVGIYDNGRIIIAENKNESASGRLTGKQSMELIYVDHSADARVQFCALNRIHFTTGFVEIDKDGDKVLMRAEITHHYPLNAERIIKEADRNNDGKLTQKEWEDWKKKNGE